MIVDDAQISATLPESARPSARWMPWLLPVGVLFIAYVLLGLSLTQQISPQDISRRSVLFDPNRARIWSICSVETGLAFLGVFIGMLSYFKNIFRRRRQHIVDLGLLLLYLAASFAFNSWAVRNLHSLQAFLVGDAVVLTFTTFVSRKAWFRRLLGVFLPAIFLTCGIGLLLDGLSFWTRTFVFNTPWNIMTAELSFAVLLNASRFPAFLRGEDVEEELKTSEARADRLQKEINLRVAAEAERLAAEDDLNAAEAGKALAEKQRSHSEARYRTLFETMAQGVTYRDRQGAIIAANPAAERIMNLPLDQILGQKTFQMMGRTVREDGSPLTDDQHPSMLALRTGAAVLNAIVGIHDRNGDGLRWLRISATPEFQTDDTEAYIAYSIFEDVTESRRAEAEIRSSEQRLRLALESGRLGSWEFSVASDTYVNMTDICRTQFGMPDEGPVTRSQLQSTIHPNDVGRVRAAVQEAMEQGQRFEAAYRVLRTDGSARSIRAYGAPVMPANGGPATGMVGMTEDITERQAEQEALHHQDELLRTVISGAPLILWAADKNGVFTLSAGKGLDRLAMQHQVVGQSVFDLYSENPDIVERLWRVLGGEAVKFDMDVAGVNFHTEVSPERNAAGEVVGAIGVAIDRTEYARAEAKLDNEREELRRSEARLSEAQRIAHLGGWEFDAIKGRRYWSEEMYRILGLDPTGGPPDEATLQSYYHPDDWLRRTQSIQLMLETGKPVELDVRGFRPNGELRWCHLTAELFKTPEGEISRIVGTATDITDRVFSEERFRLLFESSQDAVMVIDPRPEAGGGAVILDGNAAAVAMLGRKDKSEIIGQHPYGFAPEFQPDGRPSRVPRPEILAALQDGKSIRFEFTHSGGRGADVPVETVLTPLMLGGSPRVLSISRDLTEQRRAEAALHESEEHLRLALEGGEFGAWDYDIQANEFSNASPRLRQLFGRSPNERFTWSDLKAAIYPDDLPLLAAMIRDIVLSHNSITIEHRIICPDGAIRWLVGHIRAIFDSEGHATRLIGINYDITERKELERIRQIELADAEGRADHDPLSGLLNHRAFQRELAAALDHADAEGQPVALALVDLTNFKYFNEFYGHLAGDDVLRDVAERLRTVYGENSILARFGGDEFAILLRDISGDSVASDIESRVTADLATLDYRPDETYPAIPIAISVGAALYIPGGSHSGGQVPERQSLLEFADERLRRAKTGADVESEARRVRASAGLRVEGFLMLDALVTAVDNKDRYTLRHSEDVMRYSIMIADEMGIRTPVLGVIAEAALLHDVGKIGIPDAILRKPGKLTEDEYLAIKQHPVMGAVIVAAVPGLDSTLDAVRHHHERWDGGGYPNGFVGDETPLIARLMAVADAFSAMTTDRPYRRGMAIEEAIKILQDGAGSQWDPSCVTAFLRGLRKAKK